MIKRTLWMLVVALLAAGSGCQHHNLANSCGGCGAGGCPTGRCGMGPAAYAGARGGQICGVAGCRGQCGRPGCLGMGAGRPPRVGRVPHNFDPTDVTPGPPSASYAYPYYTTLGPRDFLMDNPPSIGR